MRELRTGTIREKRLKADVVSNHFKIDQQSFSDLLGYISRFLQEVNYYDLQNERSGDWQALVESDPIFKIVSIVKHPITELQDLIENYSDSKSDKAEKEQVISKILTWIDLIETWESELREVGEMVIADKIENILTDVLGSVRWELQSDQLLLSGESVSKEDKYLKLNQKADNEIYLEKLIHTFTKAVVLIQNSTAKYLNNHLYSRSDHQPHTALYIVFVLLFETFQKNLNQLSQKHLDFYFNDVLRLMKGTGKDSQAVVCFELLPGVENMLVPQNLKLSAGKLFGSKSELFFYTQKPFAAYPVQVNEIDTLYFNYSKVIDVGTTNPIISSVSKRTVWLNGKKDPKVKSWQLFGADAGIQWEASVDPDEVADFGFIIQSPVLLLEEGEREIKLTIRFKDSSKQVLWKLVSEIATSQKHSKNTVISEIFESGLKVSLTTEKGWQETNRYIIAGDETQNNLTITIKQGIVDPALTKIKKDGHLQWPAIRVMLNEYAPVYLYSFFKGVEVERIDVEVNVEGVKNLTIYSNGSQIKPGKPFSLFGSRPAKGDEFLIGKSEFFIKKLDSMEVNLRWQTLPEEDGGFATYYSSYSYDYENSSFQVQPSVLQNGVWNTLDMKAVPLFEDEEIEDKGGYTETILKDKTPINIDVDSVSWVEPSAIQSPLKLSVDSIAGFFKFTLISPDPGFGFNLYQEDYTRIAVENARNKTNYPLPNKPLSPKVSEISVDYSASDTLYFDNVLSEDKGINRGVFQHITPFVTADVIRDGEIRDNTLLYNYNDEGYFFMGLSNVTMGATISIYFQLSSINLRNTADQKVKWEYYNVNDWKVLEGSYVVLDDTDGFMKSGIVELILPDVTKETLSAQEGVYWLRISTDTDAVSFPKVDGVFLNAVMAQARNTPTELMGEIIPAGSINKLVTKQPGIKAVVQPDNSSGEKGSESEDEYYVRVSERLRHKGRAVSLWDYERLVLERFPDVNTAKCNNLNEDGVPVPGTVNVIVLSKRWTNDKRWYYNTDKLLEIEEYLQKRASSFVNVSVCNPTEEYLLVNVAVRFNKLDTGGYFLDQLNLAITKFLSPKDSSDNGLGGIGGSILPSSITSYIENLSYIDQVYDLKVEHIIVKGNNQFILGVYAGDEEITVNSPQSLLISVKRHRITTVLDDTPKFVGSGIGEMEIGLDLIVPMDDVSAKNLDESGDDDPGTNDAVLVFKKVKNDE